MKRIKKTTEKVLKELRKKGVTNKQLMKELGIKERTFYSYSRYFSGSKINKNSRKPPKEVEQKIRNFAGRKKVRLTYDIGKRIDGVLVYIKTHYLIDRGGNKEIRNMVIPMDLEEWREKSNKKRFLRSYIKRVYMKKREDTDPVDDVEILFYKMMLNRDL